jgi:hypothetical protein
LLASLPSFALVLSFVKFVRHGQLRFEDFALQLCPRVG